MYAVGDCSEHGPESNQFIASTIIRSLSGWFRTYGFADVLEDLVIGAYPLDEEDVAMLARLQVGSILNLVEDKEYEPGQHEVVFEALSAAGIEEQRLSLADYGRLPPEELETAVRVVNGWLDSGRRVYVHCRAGWQRSAAVAAGVIAVRLQLDIEEALDLLRTRKPSSDPLPHQREDLRNWWEDRQANAAPAGGGENELQG